MGSPVYRFGEFRLDPACRELWRGDEEVSLPPKAFGCLAYLVEHRDRAVGRDELIDAIWDKQNLGDSVLGHAILATRRALQDTGDEHRFIKTVQGFGYRWVAPVEVEVETAADAAAETATDRTRRPWRWATLTGLTVGALALGATYLWRDEPMRTAGEAKWRREEGDIALLLPVTVEPADDTSWIRFGVMELIAERLRDAGQPMVPSETVIALTRDLPAEPGPRELESLISTTGSRLILGARAEATGTRWRVSVRGLNGDSPLLTAFAESDDVLEAARLAADQMVLSLGLTAAPEPDAEPGLGLLLRRTEAAMLAQQMAVAHELIESAGAELRRRPEVRLQAARIALFRHDLEGAQSTFESLLEEPSLRRDPKLRARVLLGLGVVHFQRGDHDSAESLLQEAMEALDRGNALATRGTIQRTLGSGAVMRGELDAARMHLAQARKALEGTGDARGLAMLDNNRGVLETLREHYTEALSYFERAADLHAALHDVGGELRARANMVEIQLGLLEPDAGMALEPRLSELLAQTTNPEIRAVGNLAKVALLDASGRPRAAEDLLVEVLQAIEPRDDLFEARTWARVLRAEQLARRGDLEQAAGLAGEAIEQALSHDDVLLNDSLGRAWLVMLRARLSDGDLAAATEIARRMSDWAERSPTGAPRIYAALARAEMAAAAGRAVAADAFEEALALADAGRVPLRTLQVAESYVPWLLGDRSDASPRAARALTIVDRLARYADQDYRVARLQLRVYRALGPASSWRAALGRARALAGERRLPPELLTPPQNP